MKKLPKTVYVRREQDGDGGYLLAHEQLTEMVENGEDGDAVGVYVLQLTRRLKKHSPTLE